MWLSVLYQVKHFCFCILVSNSKDCLLCLLSYAISVYTDCDIISLASIWEDFYKTFMYKYILSNYIHIWKMCGIYLASKHNKTVLKIVKCFTSFLVYLNNQIGYTTNKKYRVCRNSSWWTLMCYSYCSSRQPSQSWCHSPLEVHQPSSCWHVQPSPLNTSPPI